MITSNQANEEIERKHSSAGGSGDIKAAVATSRQWSAQTESRIVRVSRVFGGKDRHSKVKTVKGLRDRRVRLSVPTAIQLYDLQDRLGLNQPSKVVDWLLNAARHEIDKLPPLQFPPQDFISGHLPSSMPMVHEEKFSHCPIATSVGWNTNGEKAGVGAKSGGDDHAGGRFPASYRFLGLNHALGMAGNSIVAPMAHHGSYNYTGESWNNTVHAQSTTSPFPSMLSLAPGSHDHQLVFFSSEAEQFPAVDTNLGSQSLSLSSARAFHDQQGS